MSGLLFVFWPLWQDSRLLFHRRRKIVLFRRSLFQRCVPDVRAL